MSPLSRLRAVRALLILVFALSASAAFGAGRQVRSAEIDQARQLIAEAEFDRALEVINTALRQQHHTDQMLGTLYELQGTTYLYLGQEQKARESFERLLQAVPDFEMAQGTSPKLRSLFDQVQQDVASRKLKPVSVAHDGPRRVSAGQVVDIDAQVANLPETARTRLYYRRAGNEGYSSAFFSELEDGEMRAQIPAFEVPEQSDDYALEYYIEVADAAGRRLAGAGNSLEPLLIEVTGQVADALPQDAIGAEQEHWYQKWWVWAIAGGVAAGGVAAVTVPLMLDNQATLPVTVKVQQ